MASSSINGIEAKLLWYTGLAREAANRLLDGNGDAGLTGKAADTDSDRNVTARSARRNSHIELVEPTDGAGRKSGVEHVRRRERGGSDGHRSLIHQRCHSSSQLSRWDQRIGVAEAGAKERNDIAGPGGRGPSHYTRISDQRAGSCLFCC